MAIKKSKLVDTTATLVVPVIEESVRVHKTLADNGGVRVSKIVHRESTTVDEELISQSVTLVRVPINREVEGPVHIRYENGATIIPVVEERLITRRQMVLVEEVHIRRSDNVSRRPETVVLRREELIIERQDPGSSSWTRIESDPA